MINIKKAIESIDWDQLVKNTYGKPYCFQQQAGCREKGSYTLVIPSSWTDDENYPVEITEEINGEEMGVQFSSWLARDVSKSVGNRSDSWEIELFWLRNFYPDVDTVANDLYSKGLIEAGEYLLVLDW